MLKSNHDSRGLSTRLLVAVLVVATICCGAEAEAQEGTGRDTVVCGCSFRDAVRSTADSMFVVLPVTLVTHKYPQALVMQMMFDGSRFSYIDCTVPNCSGFGTFARNVEIVRGWQAEVVSLDLTNASWGDYGDADPPQEIDVELRFAAHSSDNERIAGIPGSKFTGPCNSAMLIFGTDYAHAVIRNCDDEKSNE